MTSANAFTLGIIAGGDQLPVQLVARCQEQARHYFIIGFENITDMSRFENVPASQKALVRIGAVGDVLTHIQKAQIKEIVFAGKFTRPSLMSLRQDATAAKLLPRVAKALMSGGDNALLTQVLGIIEEQGVKVIGAHDLLPELLAPEGSMGINTPDLDDLDAINKGVKAALELGERDEGQAVVVLDNQILEEDRKGTDALIERAAKYKQSIPRGVLAKMEKPGQDRRVDLPAIGFGTIQKAHAAGLKGIVYHAGSTLIIGDRNAIIEFADSHGLFLFGVKP